MEILGEYEYDKKMLLGHGSYAVVYKGRHRKNGTPVAVKCIKKKDINHPEDIILKEINILKQLHHENIVTLHECVVKSPTYFLVIEFCNGGDLADYLQAKGTLSEDTIRYFFRQVISAMKVMNDKGIIHRDLKPQNLLLSYRVADPKPQDIVIKIADFGFARSLKGNMMAATLCGSPLYMAPEVLMHNQYNAKADLWSVGCIIYQCLVGRPPFHAPSQPELRKYYEQSRKVVPKIPNSTSRVLTDLLFKLLRRNMKERINFVDFFDHEFFFLRNKTSPVPVPIRQNSSFATPNSSSTSDSRSVVESPQVGTDCSPSEGDPLYLKSSSSSDSEDFVMVSHPFSSGHSIMENTNLAERIEKRKNSAPVISQKTAVLHRKQRSQGSFHQSAEDKEVARMHSRRSEAPSPFMQRAVEGSNSPITVRFSALSRRRAGSSSDSDASSHSRPSPVPIPVPTQAENFNRLDRQASRPKTSSLEDKPKYAGLGARSVSPLCVDKKVQGRSSPHFVHPTDGPVPALQKALKMFGSPAEIPTIMENPEVTSPRVDIPHNFKFIIDNKHETLAVRMARAWTAPDFAKLKEKYSAKDYQLVRSKSSSKLQKQETEIEVSNIRTDARNLARLKHLRLDSASSKSILETDLVLGEETTPLAEFKFYCRLSDSICEVAEQHTLWSCDSAPGGMARSYLDQLHHQTQKQKQCQQLLLYLKALQVVATALHTLRNKVKAGSLPVTKGIKEIAKELNQRYKKFAKLCEEAKALCDLNEKTRISFISADKILYFQAIGDCHSAALDEMFESNSNRCLQRYKRALVLLEGISLVTNDDLDRRRLSKYKKGIRYRLQSLEKSESRIQDNL